MSQAFDFIEKMVEASGIAGERSLPANLRPPFDFIELLALIVGLNGSPQRSVQTWLSEASHGSAQANVEAQRHFDDMVRVAGIESGSIR